MICISVPGKFVFVSLYPLPLVALANMPEGSQILAPSAIQLSGKMWTDSEGLQDHNFPLEMSESQIQSCIQEFVHAEQLAIEAGFDGVEIHAANGYLIEQFLNPRSITRQGRFGGSAENRMRFVLEVAQKIAQAIGPERTGIRISPCGVFNDTGAFEGIAR